MTARQQRVVEFICDSAVKSKTPIYFEIRQPRDDREGARLKLSRKPFPSMFDTDAIGISPDGEVRQVGFTQSYDRELSSFIKRVLNKAKKLP